MPSLLIVLLFLHIAAAILAFGPTYMFPLTMRMAAAEPEHRAFVSRVNLAISEKVTLPLGISMGVTGVLMIFVGNIPVALWLQLAIVLYLGLVGYSFFVQMPLSRRLLAEMGRVRGPMATGAGARPGGSSAAPGGPPPEFLAMVRRAQLGGMAIGIVTLIIVALMVWKPTL